MLSVQYLSRKAWRNIMNLDLSTDFSKVMIRSTPNSLETAQSVATADVSILLKSSWKFLFIWLHSDLGRERLVTIISSRYTSLNPSLSANRISLPKTAAFSAISICFGSSGSLVNLRYFFLIFYSR